MEQLARSLHTAAPNVPAVLLSAIHTAYAVYYTKYSTVCLYVDLEAITHRRLGSSGYSASCILGDKILCRICRWNSRFFLKTISWLNVRWNHHVNQYSSSPSPSPPPLEPKYEDRLTRKRGMTGRVFATPKFILDNIDIYSFFYQWSGVYYSICLRSKHPWRGLRKDV